MQRSGVESDWSIKEIKRPKIRGAGGSVDGSHMRRKKGRRNRSGKMKNKVLELAGRGRERQLLS